MIFKFKITEMMYIPIIKDGIRVIVDHPAIQNPQWLNYTLQLIPKQVLNMSEFNWTCEKRKIMAYFLFKSYKPLVINEYSYRRHRPKYSCTREFLACTYLYVVVVCHIVIVYAVSTRCARARARHRLITELVSSHEYENAGPANNLKHVSSANYSLISEYMCMRDWT